MKTGITRIYIFGLLISKAGFKLSVESPESHEAVLQEYTIKSFC